MSNAAKPTKINSICAYGVNLTMMVFMGIYAFDNPDGYSDTLGCYVYRTSPNGDFIASQADIHSRLTTYYDF